MYTRTYNDDKHGILIPDSYGGTALYGEGSEDSRQKSGSQNEGCEDACPACAEANGGESVEAVSLLSRIRIPDFLKKILKIDNFSLQKIGVEEILIIAAAAFLLFSDDGDGLCALILLALLFIS